MGIRATSVPMTSRADVEAARFIRRKNICTEGDFVFLLRTF
jgi:hypothetical protein